MSDFTNEGGGGEPEPTSELPATPVGPADVGPGEPTDTTPRSDTDGGANLGAAAPGVSAPGAQPGAGAPGQPGAEPTAPHYPPVGGAVGQPPYGGWHAQTPPPDPTWPGHPGPGGPGQPPGAGQWPGGPGPAPGWAGGGWGWIPPGSGWSPPPGAHPGATPGGPAQRARRPLMIGGAALLAAVAVLGGIGIGYSVWRPGPSSAPSSSTTPFSPATGGRIATHFTSGSSSKSSSASGGPSETAMSSIASKVDPSLVDVNTVLGDETAEAAGTGMVLTSTGKVLTNNHVIEGSTSISVTDLGNSQTYSATVIGYDRTQDVAVIQLKGASGLKTADFGNSSDVSVGESVVGIGNAGGTGGTPSTAGGSVTALNQAITASDSGSGTTEHLTGLIESNADIQPGDSGGPLVTTSDQVIGMDTAASASQGFSFSGAATGQGYSIPINTALSVAKQIEDGKASTTVHLGETAFLGVSVESASATTRFATGRFGFGDRTPTATPATTGSKATTGGSGALVAGVISGTPAQSAGIAKGEVITGLGGTTVTSPNSLTKAISQYHPGDTVKVTWTNPAGQSQSATVQLTSGPAG
jgi:S1-C subfamily serine protease